MILDDRFAIFRIDELKDAIPIEDVIEQYTGLRPNKKGELRCPKSDHDDKHPSAHITKDHKCCFCHSQCGKIDIIDLARDYYNVPNGEQFASLCFKLCEDFGVDPEKVSDYAERKARQGTKKGKPEFQEKFPLKASELAEIGLERYNGDTIYPSELSSKVNWCYEKNRPEYDLTQEETAIVKAKQINVPSLKTLWEKDKHNVEKMLIEHIDSRIESYEKFRKELAETNAPNFKAFCEAKGRITSEGFNIKDMQELYRSVLMSIDLIVHDMELPTHTEMVQEQVVLADENGEVIPDKNGKEQKVLKDVPRQIYTPTSGAIRLANMLNDENVQSVYNELCLDKIHDFKEMRDRITDQAAARKKFNDEHKKKIKWRKELD